MPTARVYSYHNFMSHSTTNCLEYVHMNGAQPMYILLRFCTSVASCRKQKTEKSVTEHSYIAIMHMMKTHSYSLYIHSKYYKVPSDNVIIP